MDELENTIKEWAKNLADRFAQRISVVDGDTESHQPFHDALFPPDSRNTIKFERSFSTGLGTLFEQCAVIIATPNFDVVERQHVTKGLIPKGVLKQISLTVNSTDQNKRIENYTRETKYMAELASQSDTDTDFAKVTSDLYLRKNSRETFFELKAPKPNKGQCQRMLQDSLYIHGILKKSPPEVNTYVGMAYNPFGESSNYTYGIAKRYLDIKRQVMVGKTFWEFLGGPNTYEQLLDIFIEVGDNQCRKMFDDAMNWRAPHFDKSSG